MTFFIYFSLISEVFIAVFALILFFLPGYIAKWASIFFWISEFPILSSKQIIVIISDAGVVSYATFGIPLLFLSPFLYLFLVWTLLSFMSLFEATADAGRTRFGLRKRK